MAFQGDSIYWVELEKVVPNPFQPRREFDQNKLQELADSIRMYGVLQPLTVTRAEVQRDDGTFYTEYELIAGERRLRASKLAGVAQVPVIIREGHQSEQEKLELAIIENLQREDLNAVDRALAFRQLADSFGLSHVQVAQKVGRSREYVSNSIRLLGLPDHMLDSLKRSEMMEGHARTLLMLTDRPEEQEVVFREVLLKKMSVREVERIVRKIATDKVRKKNASDLDVNLIELEKQFTETLGTRVQIQKTDFGGKLTIDYFSEDDLSVILRRIGEESKTSEQSHQEEQDTIERLSEHTPLAVETEQATVVESTQSQPDNKDNDSQINNQSEFPEHKEHAAQTENREYTLQTEHPQPTERPQHPESPQYPQPTERPQPPVEPENHEQVAQTEHRIEQEREIRPEPEQIYQPEVQIPLPPDSQTAPTPEVRPEPALYSDSREEVQSPVQTHSYPGTQKVKKDKEPDEDESGLYSINNFTV